MYVETKLMTPVAFQWETSNHNFGWFQQLHGDNIIDFIYWFSCNLIHICDIHSHLLDTHLCFQQVQHQCFNSCWCVSTAMTVLACSYQKLIPFGTYYKQPSNSQHYSLSLWSHQRSPKHPARCSMMYWPLTHSFLTVFAFKSFILASS